MLSGEWRVMTRVVASPDDGPGAGSARSISEADAVASRASKGAAHVVQQDAFEGPLDLLLQLVERERLPVTDVCLAAVTDGYLRAMDGLDVQPEELSRFVAIASRLLVLKSRSLLPRPPAPEPPETDPEDLAAQLRLYRQYKRAAAILSRREGQTSYAQLAPPPAPERPVSPVSLPVAALERALRRTVERRERGLPDGQPVRGLTLRVADYAARAERLLARDGRAELGRLLGVDASREERVVAFLAALDLVRRRRARVVQDGLFAPVVLLPAEDGA